MSIEASQLVLSTITALASGFIAGLAAYFGSRIKKSGEIDTLTAKIEEVRDQQIVLTSATEKVKYDIEHQVWRKKEQETIKRDKLENYYIQIGEIINDMYAQVNRSYFGLDVGKPYTRAAQNTYMIQQLYLPELLHETFEVHRVAAQFEDWISQLMQCKVQSHSTQEQMVIYGQLDEWRNKIIPHIVNAQSAASTLSTELSGMMIQPNNNKN